MPRHLTDRRGFTLIELIVVMALVGALAIIILPKYTSKVQQGNIATTKANIESLRNAVSLYSTDNNSACPNASLSSLVPTYLRAVPKEAVTGVATVVNAQDNAGGWYYNTTTCEIVVNKAGNDANGVAYSTY